MDSTKAISQKMDVPDIYNLVFQNLRLLCLIHPNSQDVQKVLKQDMFKVPDFKAFQHVMNFLLNLLIPEQWKKLIVWPVFDRKTEYQFRLAVKKALTEVNQVYVSENLPVARAAILTNAGGKDFATFVFRLTIVILHKSLVEKYGLSDLLFAPLSSDSHSMEKNKLIAFRELAENSVQNLIDSLGLGSAAIERDIDMRLKDVKEEIKNEEQRLFKLVQPLSLPEEIKKDLLDPKSSLGIEKWVAEVEMGIKKQNKTMAFLDHIGNEVSWCKQIIESSVEHAASGTCIDLSSAKEMIEAQSRAILLEDLPRISDIILVTNELLNAKADEIHKNGVPDLTAVLYSLKDLAAEFDDLEKNVDQTYSELENKLEEHKNSSCVTQNGEESGMAGNDKILESPELNFYRRMSTGNNREALFGTPKSGATKKLMEKPVCKPNFDSELLLSPSLSTTTSSPADTDIKYRSLFTQPSTEFCMPQTRGRFIPQSESKFKPQATNLSSLTGSLLKSSSKANLRGKALSTICNRKAFRHLQRDNDGRHLATVSKTLFGKDSSLPENSPKAFSPSADSEGSLWDSAGDIKENALDLYSSISLQSEITSPSAILSSTKVEESEQAQTKKRKPRKSLEALIARYKKVVNGSKDLKIKQDTL